MRVAAFMEAPEAGLEQREPEASLAPARADCEIEHPAKPKLSEAEGGTHDLVTLERELPELGIEVTSRGAPVEPALERMRCEFPVLGEGGLVHSVKSRVVCARAIGADGEPRGHVRRGRRLVDADLHPPEVADVLEAALLEQPPALVVDDMRVQALELPLLCPRLGALDEARPDSPSAEVGVDTRLVLHVREVGSFAIHPGEPNCLAFYDGEPGIRLELFRLASPPLPQLCAAEADRAPLVEVGPIARLDEIRDRRRIVQGRRTEGQHLVQSGWPDSNRRLLRPKRSTLTRLSYTPSLGRAYSVTVRADKFAFGDLGEDQRTVVTADEGADVVKLLVAG
jgi:hypothetical protein